MLYHPTLISIWISLCIMTSFLWFRCDSLLAKSLLWETYAYSTTDFTSPPVLLSSQLGVTWQTVRWHNSINVIHPSPRCRSSAHPPRMIPLPGAVCCGHSRRDLVRSGDIRTFGPRRSCREEVKVIMMRLERSYSGCHDPVIADPVIADLMTWLLAEEQRIRVNAAPQKATDCFRYCC